MVECRSSNKGKTVLITGGTGGLGEKIIDRLARSGIKNIYFTFHKETQKAKIIANEILEKYPANCKGFQCDVSKISDIQSVVDEIVSDTDTIDILINNAAIMQNKFWLYMSETEWDSVIDTNLKGYFNCIKVVVRFMIRNRYGRIVNISSLAGSLGALGQVNYSASKAGIIGLTKTATLEFGKYNIKVFTVTPGLINGGMIRNFSEPELHKMITNIPMGRLGEPSEVADLVTFLISDLVNISNGSEIVIDGGLSLAYE